MLGHTKDKVGTVSHFYPMINVFLLGKDGTQKVIDYSQVNQQSNPVVSGYCYC